MIKRSAPMAVSALVFGVLAAGPARADITVTWHMTIDSPMMKNMPDQARAMMDSFMNPMTIYAAGKQSRTDTPMMSVIIDRGTEKMIMVNKFAKTYYVTTFDPTTGPQMPMPGGGPTGGAGKPTDVHVTDTGKTRTILGHKCHEVIVTGKYEEHQGGNMSFSDDMWVAADLHAGDATSTMPFGGVGATASKIDGFPLEMTVSLSGGRTDGTKVSIETTNISTDSVPASTFQVPDGYTKSNNPGFGGPGMGGPGMGGGFRPGMGGGMPGQ